MPQDIVPINTIRIILLIEVQDILNLNDSVMQGTNKKHFNFVLTHNPNLLENCKIAQMFEFGTSWIKNYTFPEKEFSVSTLVGGKLYAEGHYLRQKVWFKEKRIKKIPTKFFLSGNLGGIENYNNNPILGKDKLALFNSQFHICIENTQRKNWFTEKLIDCLQTKTIPIYYGCPNIGEWFNIDGFIIVNNLDDIINYMALLKCYRLRKKAQDEFDLRQSQRAS